jgi:hypothetical protein
MTTEEIKNLSMELSKNLAEVLFAFAKLNFSANKTITEAEKFAIGITGAYDFFFTVIHKFTEDLSHEHRKGMLDFLRQRIDLIEKGTFNDD